MKMCSHYAQGVCAVASEIAGRQAETHWSSCDFCERRGKPPQGLNEVTVSLAIRAVRDDVGATRRITDEYGHLVPAIVEQRARQHEHSERLHAVMHGVDVGSQLWRLLESLGIRHTPDCECLALAEQLNAWGPAGCRLARAEIVERMRRNAKAYAWTTVATAAGKALANGVGWRLDLTDVYGSLLDEAIRLAEAAETAHAMSTLPAS